jgi:hypothetical protein
MVAIVVGGVIGSGIFLVPPISPVASHSLLLRLIAGGF